MEMYKDIVSSVEALQQWTRKGSGLQSRNLSELYWALPQDMGKGYFSITKLQHGMVMACADFCFTTELAGSFEFKSRPIAFNYSVSGEMSMVHSEEGTPLYSCRSGYEILSSLALGKVNVVPPNRLPFKCVCIYLDPAIFFTIFPGMEEYVHPDLRDVATRKDEAFYYHEEPATIGVQAILYDILACPYQGPYRQFFMRSKCMELMTHTLWRSRQCVAVLDKEHIRQADMERVKNAKAYMDLHFRTEIKLLQLAQHVGLAHSKLNFYFRQVYGTTVFGYLRELRMNEARFLLSKGEANVTEAAYSVGYSSLSHFAKVFKQHCGQAPGDFMRLAGKSS